MIHYLINKRLSVAFLFLAMLNVTFAQENVGIQFKDITLSKALEEAAATNKKVFVDCYTQTCGPCKYMAKNIFTLKDCGDYFNPLFVSVMKDMGTPEGKEIAKKYDVGIYPTFLFLNPDGTLYSKMIGATTLSSKVTFPERVKASLALAELTIRFNKGERDTTFINDYLRKLKADNSPLFQPTCSTLLMELPAGKRYDAEGWDIFDKNIRKTSLPAFKDFIENRSTIISSIGKERFETKIKNVFENEFNLYYVKGDDLYDRMCMLKALESEGYSWTEVLSDRMRIRDIIDKNRKESLNEINNILTQSFNKNIPAQAKTSLISELRGYENVATAKQKSEMVTLLTKLKRTNPAAANKINTTISKMAQ